MSQTHFSSSASPASSPASGHALWRLLPGQAMSLTIGPGPRELSVTTGRLWLTRQGNAQQGAEDIWLAPGESLSLAGGSRIVVEGWPQASFQLLVPPQACAQYQPAQQPRAAAAPAAARLSWPGAPAAA